ncbi:EamA family transporter, partial [Actinoplanes sp. NPDC049596]|uniref:DMT family transporter n=1 Tax=Actinoplanes sp. NPDC049596 TaxID=3154625 RepID=UPI003424CE1B
MSRSSMPSANPHQAGLSNVALAATFWGTTGPAVQLLHHSAGLSPAAIGFYRLAIAAVVLLIPVIRQFRTLTAAFWSAPLTLIVAGAGLGTYQALYFEAVAKSGVATATVISLGLAPVLTTGWDCLQTRRLPAPLHGWSLTAALAGLALISSLGNTPTAATPQPLLGAAAAVGSGVGYAATTILTRDILNRVAPTALTGASTAIGALVLLPVALHGTGITFALRPVTAGMLGYLGVVTTAAAYALFHSGLRTVSAGAAALVTLLEPLTATVLATLILNEPISPALTAGSVLLLSAVVMT